MEEQVRILCVDDEVNVLRALERIFLDDDYEIITATSGDQGLEELERWQPVQIVVSDYRMPGMNGVDFLREVYKKWPETVRIVLSGYADTAAVVAAINDGQIYKFIPKPWNDDELRVTINNAIERYFLHQKNATLTAELQGKNEELLAMNQNLEKLVVERTAELTLQNRALVHSQNILDALPVGVVGVVPDGAIVRCNCVAASILGIDQGGILGENFRDLFPPELTGFIDQVFNDSAAISRICLQGDEICLRGVHIQSDAQNGAVLVLDRGCHE